MSAPKIGFVFQGGGDHGVVSATFAYQLMRQGFIPDVVSGASAGILNAWTLGFCDIDRLMQLWYNIKGQSDVFESNYWLTLPWKSGYFKTAKLQKLVEDNIGAQTIPMIACGGVVVDSYTRQKLTVTPEDRPQYWDGANTQQTLTIAETMVASCSIPVVAEAMKNRFTDGGQRENAPLKFCIDQGCEVIFVFCNSPFPPIPREPKAFPFPGIIHRAQNAIECILEENLVNDLARAERHNKDVAAGGERAVRKKHRQIMIKVMSPRSEPEGSMLDFKPADIQANGEMAANCFREILNSGELEAYDFARTPGFKTIAAKLEGSRVSGAV